MEKEGSLIHYWQLPKGIFISLKPEFHERFSQIIQNKLNDTKKNCFYKILKCPKWHAQRLFTGFNRMTIDELETLMGFVEVPGEEVEQNIETIGCHEDGTIIKNPKLPFQLKDLVYVASHLMFDGSYRDKKGGYFYAYEPSLVEYHKKRLSAFGEVPINFIEHENQLYFSHTIGYIAKEVLEIKTFNSTETYLSEKFKKLAKNKEIAEEIVKALIIDEGCIEDKIEVELSNEILVKDLYEIFRKHYQLTSIRKKKHTSSFNGNPKWKYNSTNWCMGFSAKSFQELFNSISPLPIDYKEENLKFLFDRKNKNYKQRKCGETKKLIVQSILQSPKTMNELAKELLVKQTTIRAHLKGHPRYEYSLIGLGIVNKVDEKILRRGGYAKVGVYGITDLDKAKEFLNV